MKRYPMSDDCSLPHLIVLEWLGVPLPIPTHSSFCAERSALNLSDKSHVGTIIDEGLFSHCTSQK